MGKGHGAIKRILVGNKIVLGIATNKPRNIPKGMVPSIVLGTRRSNTCRRTGYEGRSCSLGSRRRKDKSETSRMHIAEIVTMIAGEKLIYEENLLPKLPSRNRPKVSTVMSNNIVFGFFKCSSLSVVHQATRKNTQVPDTLSIESPLSVVRPG